MECLIYLWLILLFFYILDNIGQILTFFSVPAAIDSRDLLPPGAEEIKDGQWMGVTVRSQGRGGKVLVIFNSYC